MLLAYRRRGEGDALVLARSADGVAFTAVTELTAAELGVTMVERAALVRAGSVWRLYVSCAGPGDRSWWIGLLEAPRPEDFRAAEPREITFGGPLEAVKDPIVHWFERCGRAVPRGTGPALTAVGTQPLADIRYLDILTLPNGTQRAYFEARRPDGPHELRSAAVLSDSEHRPADALEQPARYVRLTTTDPGRPDQPAHRNPSAAARPPTAR
ncbi:hypothetical protein AB0J80_35545 [Actinoplanes sp. NPDC049548]|uniref:hypothetical protein n=1 Tax=Actinoplanes sp. NPDC049548 TaxID=3155152 RepID=UPI00343C1627